MLFFIFLSFLFSGSLHSNTWGIHFHSFFTHVHTRLALSFWRHLLSNILSVIWRNSSFLTFSLRDILLDHPIVYTFVACNASSFILHVSYLHIELHFLSWFHRYWNSSFSYCFYFTRYKIHSDMRFSLLLFYCLFLVYLSLRDSVILSDISISCKFSFLSYLSLPVFLPSL